MAAPFTFRVVHYLLDFFKRHSRSIVVIWEGEELGERLTALPLGSRIETLQLFTNHSSPHQPEGIEVKMPATAV